MCFSSVCSSLDCGWLEWHCGDSLGPLLPATDSIFGCQPGRHMGRWALSLIAEPMPETKVGGPQAAARIAPKSRASSRPHSLTGA